MLLVLTRIPPTYKHDWCKAAQAAAPGSPERERYMFRDGKGANGSQPPNDWKSVFGGRAWTRITEADGTPGQWYLHLFDSSQPDFNWENRKFARISKMSCAFGWTAEWMDSAWMSPTA